MIDKALSMLGLARRAGRLSLGFDASVGSGMKGESRLILVAADISPKSEKELRYALRDKRIEIIKCDYTEDDFGGAVGKRVRIISVNDAGFAAQVRKLLPSNLSIIRDNPEVLGGK